MGTYQRIANGKITTVKDGNQPYIYVGLDAGKPTPGQGDIAICTDSGKIYTCYVSGYWAIVNSNTSEEYHNHMGTVDAFLTSAVTGNGTATADAANHEMDLSSGIGAAGSAIYRGGIDLVPSEVQSNFGLNIKIKNYIQGAIGTRRTLIGMFADINDPTGTTAGAYLMNDTTGWTYQYHNGGGDSFSGAIPALASGDLVTIKGREYSVGDAHIDYMVNGVLVATVDGLSSLESCYPGIGTNRTTANGTTAMSISCDYIGIKVIK